MLFQGSKFKFFIFIALIFVSINAIADSRPNYQMRGANTDLWDMDVDYFSPPILLTRNSNTFAIHNVNFNVTEYRKFCAYWESRCVQYDQQGRCVSWERYCARWDYQTIKVPRQISINLRKATPLAANEVEVFELTINKSRPFDEGVDQVSTWLKEETVLSPVKVIKFSDYNYAIEKK